MTPEKMTDERLSELLYNITHTWSAKAAKEIGAHIAALEADIASARNAALEEAAQRCIELVVGGRARTHDQAVAAAALFDSAEAIRALKSAPIQCPGCIKCCVNEQQACPDDAHRERATVENGLLPAPRKP